jgi:hypothetical protein
MDRFHHLKIGLGLVPTFVVVKMFLVHAPYKIDTLISLYFVLGIFAVSIVASLLRLRHPVAFDHLTGPDALNNAPLPSVRIILF